MLDRSSRARLIVGCMQRLCSCYVPGARARGLTRLSFRPHFPTLTAFGGLSLPSEGRECCLERQQLVRFRLDGVFQAAHELGALEARRDGFEVFEDDEAGVADEAVGRPVDAGIG